MDVRFFFFIFCRSFCCVQVMSYDGTRRSVFVTDMPHPFSLTILGNHLYWTDWQRRSVERVDKNSGSNRATVLDQLPDIMGIKGLLTFS